MRSRVVSRWMLWVVCAAPLVLGGCAGAAFAGRGPAYGLIYAGGKSPVMVTSNPIGTKRGSACANSVLGFVTWGDASVSTAAGNGGITKVATVDQATMSVLFFYARYCVEVTGE